MRKYYRNSLYTIHNADSFLWLRSQRANSFHAVVTDPPFVILEYTPKELAKRRKGQGGIWRLPNAFDGAKRQPMPRFTVLDAHDRMGVLAFHLRLAPELFRVLVPGARDARVAVLGVVFHVWHGVLHGRVRGTRTDHAVLSEHSGEGIVRNLANKRSRNLALFRDHAMSHGYCLENPVKGESSRI